MKKDIFTQQLQSYNGQLTHLNRTFKNISALKFLHVAFTGWLLYVIFTGMINPLLAILGALVAGILCLFWYHHARLERQISHAKGHIAINQRHLARINGDWVKFSDIGQEFQSAEHPYASDLDVVGKKSLFQFLNTTKTWHGRQQFAQDLLKPSYDEPQIYARQQAIAELSENIPLANEWLYRFEQVGVQSGAKYMVEHLQKQGSFTVNPLLRWFPIFGSLAYFGQVSRYLEHVNRNFNDYSQVLQFLMEQTFQSEKLQEIQNQLKDSEQAIKELGAIGARANLRRSYFVWLFLNLFLNWDLGTAVKLNKWQSKYAHKLENWFERLGEFESLLAFSHLPNVCDQTSLPTVRNGKILEATQLGHPLIANEIRVCNDMKCQNHIFIISGSNMSGKTTFMRTVGINLVLARAGSYVCATQMEFSPLDMMTSMRIADNLSEGISTFYAELKRIKGIMEMAKHNPNTLFLIDEIFRGTNSVDRLVGAQTILEKLNELGSVGMITTHDLELCELTNRYKRIQNFNFSETYGEKEIIFDYKMRPGISQTTNAKYLMKMMDII